MYKATVIGHYGGGHNYNDGQTVKTKSITNQLIKRLGNDSINTIDTHGGIKSLLKSPVQLRRAIKSSNNVIMLPAHRGVRIYAPLLSIYKKKYNNHRVFYVVVGGWLPSLLKQKRLLRKSLLSFDGLFVETQTMKKALESLGFHNVFILPNFKDIEPVTLNEESAEQQMDTPYRLCTFSRVLKEKGIGDAVEAVKRINKEKKKQIFELDIYGPIDPTQIEWFECLQKEFGDSIRYKGSVPTEKSTEVLKNYYALLFPTHYYTEGIPGTIIDSYAAGVPVICSKWESFNDVVDDGITGLGYDIEKKDGLYNTLSAVSEEPKVLGSMRFQCQNKFIRCYSTAAIESLLQRLM